MRKILVTLVGVLVTFAVVRIAVRTLERIDGGVGNDRIPKVFVDSYALNHGAAGVDANIKWKSALSPDVDPEDITLPGGTMTYGEALHPRRARPAETPKQYLSYLSEAAKVRRYAGGLVRAWTQESEEQNGALAGK